MLFSVADGGQTLFFKKRECGVDDARARRVSAGEPLLHRLDQLIPVARLFREKLQDDQLEVAAIEHASAASAEAPLKAAPAPAEAAFESAAPAKSAVPAVSEAVAAAVLAWPGKFLLCIGLRADRIDRPAFAASAVPMRVHGCEKPAPWEPALPAFICFRKLCVHLCFSFCFKT